MYLKVLGGGLRMLNTQPRHAEDLERLQALVFPTLSREERMQAKHYLNHIRIYPEGQFVVLDGDKVIGTTSSIQTLYTEADHTFLQISDNLWFGTHNPLGDWLYGMDLGIHPDYRGQGLARLLYRARQELCRSLDLKGQLTVGMLNGYAHYRHRFSLEDYYQKVINNEINDPTIAMQTKVGFEAIKLVKGYLEDPQCGNAGVLMALDVKKNV